MGLENVRFRLTGGRGVEGGMPLDVSRLRRLGWMPRYDSEEAVRLATRAMLKSLGYETNYKAGGGV